MSPRAAAYQEQITGCPCGNAYNVNGVAFDGFRGGTLLDAKGPGYGSFVNRTTGRFHDWYEGADSLVDQAQRQLAAAGATPITWHVAEQNAAAAMQSLLGGRGVIGINIVWTPFG
jgi:hypothetical protein